MHFNLGRHKIREDILHCLQGSSAGSVVVPDRETAYEYIEQVLRRFSYG